MTNGTNNSRRPPMPRAANNAPPMAPPVHELHQAEDYARAAQRFYDVTQENMRLAAESDEWRRRALAAEEENRRAEIRQHNLQAQLEKREADLMALLRTREGELTKQIDDQREQMTGDRDRYKNQLVQLVGQFHAAGNIILRALEVADAIAGPKVNMQKLLEELSEHEPRESVAAELEESMPSIVNRGPRENE